MQGRVSYLTSGLKGEDVDARVRELIAEDCGVRISSGNTKLNNIPNFSLLPGVTCPGLVDECMFCYARRCIQYSTGAKARWAVNTHYAKHDLGRLVSDVSASLQLERPTHFRIHVGGDYFSQEY